MKVLVISAPNLPTPPPDYFHFKLGYRMEVWRRSFGGFVKTWSAKIMTLLWCLLEGPL